MLFEIKFDKKEIKKKNLSLKDEEILKLTYNTWCVKFIETMRNNGFNLIQSEDDNSIYFGMEIPSGIAKKTKLKKHSENKKIATSKELEEARKKAGDN